MTSPKPTAKQQVLKVEPEAYARELHLGGWHILNNKLNRVMIGHGRTARQAWANAAANLKGKT
jgi:hypothetical protein